MRESTINVGICAFLAVMIIVSMVGYGTALDDELTPKEEAPMVDEPLWTKDFGEYTILSPFNDGIIVLIPQEKSMHMVDDDGNIGWSNNFTGELRSYNPQIESDNYYLLTREDNSNDNKNMIHCYDIYDGNLKWEKEIISDSFVNIMGSQGHGIYVITEGDIMLISSEGDVLWGDDVNGDQFSVMSYITNYRGDLLGVTDDGEIICISPDGEIRWTSKPDGENLFLLGSPLSVAEDVHHALIDEKIYWIDDHGEFMGSPLDLDLYDFRSFFLTSDGILSLRVYDDEYILESIRKDGEMMWNHTLAQDDDNLFMFIMMGENQRLYCQYLSVEEIPFSMEKIQAFDLDGSLAWEHEIEESYGEVYVTESGIIYLYGLDGNISAYQGKPLETDSSGIPFMFIVIAVIAVFATVTAVMVISSRKKYP